MMRTVLWQVRLDTVQLYSFMSNDLTFIISQRRDKSGYFQINLTNENVFH